MRVAAAAILFGLLLALAGCEKQPSSAATTATRSADGGADLLRQQAEKLFACLKSPNSETITHLFCDTFRKNIPPHELQRTLEGYIRSLGPPQRVRFQQVLAPFSAELEFEFPNSRLAATMHLEIVPPHRISGLFFKPVVADNDSLASLLEGIKGLPGKKGLLLKRLDPKAETLLELNADIPFAIGSSFKLFLLAALAEDIVKGKRQWQEVVHLRSDCISLPSGMLQDWPIESPLTLHSLATIMLTRSDNTAADHLLQTLGRERVEAGLAEWGMAAAALNKPFLATNELFKLKLILPPETLQAYAAADEAGKRKLLADLVAKTPLREPRLLMQPLMIEQVEWFASPADQVRLLDRLRQPAWEQARLLLGILPPFGMDDTQWSYAGYKGGAECGVINFTLLLQSRRGPWYAIALTWNDPQTDVDAPRLLGLLERLVRTLQRREQAESTK